MSINTIKINPLERTIYHRKYTKIKSIKQQIPTNKTSKNPTQKFHEKYNNPLPTLNILYSNLQATFTLPSKHLKKYNKPPLFTLIIYIHFTPLVYSKKIYYLCQIKFKIKSLEYKDHATLYSILLTLNTTTL